MDEATIGEGIRMNGSMTLYSMSGNLNRFIGAAGDQVAEGVRGATLKARIILKQVVAFTLQCTLKVQEVIHPIW